MVKRGTLFRKAWGPPPAGHRHKKHGRMMAPHVKKGGRAAAVYLAIEQRAGGSRHQIVCAMCIRALVM